MPGFRHTRCTSHWLTRLLICGAVSTLAACGGSDGSGSKAAPALPERPQLPESPQAPQIPAPPAENGALPLSEAAWSAGLFKPGAHYSNLCATPRSGIDPFSGRNFPDKSGRTLDENNWLRAWTHERYLWYQEVVDSNPALHTTPDYFQMLKTEARTVSGAPKDRFHFSYPTSVWNALSEAGQSAGYGVQWAFLQSLPPRELVVLYTEPGSPATAPGADIVRGTRVLAIDGLDLVHESSHEGVDAINAALFPSEAGVQTQFTLLDPGSSVPRVVALRSAHVTATPVQNVKTFLAPNGRMVGYLQFNDHNLPAEKQLALGLEQLRRDGANELVVDLRYNAGGYIDIASQLAYMIAGEQHTRGKVFERVIFNDKIEASGNALAPLPFHSLGMGGSIPKGTPLPSLALRRVYVLTGPDTCSASESLINGLRGIDIEVVQIGATTCGKPYGYHAQNNCGTTYFSIQFRGENAKGFGDYSDGLAPTCVVPDDVEHALGDPREARLAAALTHMSTGACPQVAASARVLQSPLARPQPLLRKPEGLRGKLLWPH